jgi:hypothetical protein
MSGTTNPELAGTNFRSEKFAKTRSSMLILSTASTHCLRPIIIIII